jgi:hypothetical protein
MRVLTLRIRVYSRVNSCYALTCSGPSHEQSLDPTVRDNQRPQLLRLGFSFNQKNRVHIQIQRVEISLNTFFLNFLTSGWGWSYFRTQIFKLFKSLKFHGTILCGVIPLRNRSKRACAELSVATVNVRSAEGYPFLGRAAERMALGLRWLSMICRMSSHVVQNVDHCKSNRGMHLKIQTNN